VHRLGAIALTTAAAFAVGHTKASATAVPWAWTKAEAEYYVGGNIGLATACSPLGAPYRKGGRNYYFTFSCVLVFRTGDEYSVKIRPKSATKYATLSTIRLRTGGTTPGGTAGSYFDTGSGHWISDNSDGSVITLEDGSTWLVNPTDRFDTAIWLVVDNITVLRGTYPGYGYRLVDTDDGTTANARFLGFG